MQINERNRYREEKIFNPNSDDRNNFYDTELFKNATKTYKQDIEEI